MNLPAIRHGLFERNFGQFLRLPTGLSPPTQSVQTKNPVLTSPLDYLDLAITTLRSKQEAARSEIQRLTALEAEEADITRQFEALTQARAAFTSGEATTSSDTGATVPIEAPDQAMKTFQHHIMQ